MTSLESSLASLDDLAAKYPPAEEQQLYDISTQRAIKNEQALLDLVALAADLSVDDIINAGLEPGTEVLNVPNLLGAYPDENGKGELLEILRHMEFDSDTLGMNPLLLAALVRSYDNPLELIQKLQDRELSVDSLSFSGDLGNIKGKYFEELVIYRLNRDYVLGELRLADGHRAVFGPENQEGWDFFVEDENGAIVEYFSIKSTAIGSIWEAIRRYPEYRVLATADVEGMSEKILASDITNVELESEIGDWVSGINEADQNLFQTAILNEQMRERIRTQAEDVVEGYLENVVDNAAEITLDALPVASGVLILVTEGRAVIMGAAQLDEALKRGAKRLGRSAAFTSAGALLVAASVPGVAVTPAMLAARVWVARLGNRSAMGDIGREHANTLEELNLQRAI